MLRNSHNPNEDHDTMSAAVASNYVRRMVQREMRSAGDTEGALARLEQKYGIGFWQLSHLRSGNAKTIETSLFQRIRGAYLDYCERQISTLQHELEIEKALNADDTVEDLEREAAALAARIAQAKKARLK